MSVLQAMLRRPMLRRILVSTGSNAYAQITTIGIQLLSLPLFLSRWDVATYGQWMVLSAIPSYLSMADVGMVTAAGNRMTMLVGEGNAALANRVFQSVLAFMLSVCTAALGVLMLLALFWPVGHGVSAEARSTILVLSITIIATLLGGLPEAVYRATHRYAVGTALANTIRLTEWLGGLAGLWWGGDFFSVALGALLPRLLGTALMTLHAARTTPAFRWGFADARLQEVRACVAPAVSFMAFPAANALNFQGMTLIAASVLGPAATVMFNTYRTMARVTVQATATFGNSLWPEFSRIYGRGDLAALGVLYRRSRWLGLALATAASGVVYLAAPAVLHAWSKGRIDFVPSLMFVAMVYAAAAGGWHVGRVLLLSTNEHRALAWPYLIASAAFLPIAWLMARAGGLVAIMGSMLLLELVMLIFCSWLSHRLVAPKKPAPATIGLAA